MNFNFNSQPEYELNSSMAEETINLYGVSTKFLVVEKINRDDTVFGDYSHLKSNNSDTYDIFMLPENSEDWDSSGYNFNQFGLTNFENVILFASKSAFDAISLEGKGINGNLIVFPNNKVMEIVNVEFTVPGVNNLFTYNDAKSIYQFTCKPYDFKLINEVDNVDISIDEEAPYETLDTYFQELIDTSEDQDMEAEVIPQVPSVERGIDTDTVVNKPIVDTTEDDIFGKF